MASPSESPITFTALANTRKTGTIIAAAVFKKLSRFKLNLRKQALTTAEKVLDLSSSGLVNEVGIDGISLEVCFHVVSQSYNDLSGRRGCILTMEERGQFEIITGAIVEFPDRWMEIGRPGKKYHPKWHKSPERRYY
jgi:hypothetical protein